MGSADHPGKRSPRGNQPLLRTFSCMMMPSAVGRLGPHLHHVINYINWVREALALLPEFIGFLEGHHSSCFLSRGQLSSLSEWPACPATITRLDGIFSHGPMPAFPLLPLVTPTSPESQVTAQPHPVCSSKAWGAHCRGKVLFQLCY